VFAAALASVKAKVDAALATALWSAVAAFAGLVAFFFFIAAAYIWLRDQYTPFTATITLGVIFAVLALIAILISVMIRNSRRRRAKEQARLLAASLMGVGAELGNTMKGPEGKYLILGAIAAGWLFSKTMSRR
jgi:hypothetical protein